MKLTLLTHDFVFLLLLACAGIAPATAASGGGRWDLLQRSIGVSAMHMQLLHNDPVIIFDRTDFGQSNLSLPDGRCRHNPRERVLPVDCTAHSAEYDVASNTFRPLTVFTDTWCSSGTVAPDGTLIQTGGWNDGYRNVRTMRACNGGGDEGSCDWNETQDALAANRWYATNQILPDGRAFIAGGRRQYNYEFFPKADASDTSAIALPFLVQTRDPEENNLYPFVHLNIDGNLFIFAKNRAVLLDYKKNKIVRTYPELAGGDPRNYPSSGSSVVLPLKPSPTEADVLVCGGAPAGSYNSTKDKTFYPALVTCGRIRITDASPSWVIETMPSPRVMGDMILLPNGAEVAIINGATDGTAGWESANTPAYAPVFYRPDHSPGDRFEEQSATDIARLYHSSAILLRDGRVLVGGSNPHIYYNFSNVQYPTELSLEAFSPEYLDGSSPPADDHEPLPRRRTVERDIRGVDDAAVRGAGVDTKERPGRRHRPGVGDDGGAVVHDALVRDEPEAAVPGGGADDGGAAPRGGRLRGDGGDAGDGGAGAAGVLHGVRRERAHSQRGDLGPDTVIAASL